MRGFERQVQHVWHDDGSVPGSAAAVAAVACAVAKVHVAAAAAAVVLRLLLAAAAAAAAATRNAAFDSTATVVAAAAAATAATINTTATTTTAKTTVQKKTRPAACEQISKGRQGEIEKTTLVGGKNGNKTKTNSPRTKQEHVKHGHTGTLNEGHLHACAQPRYRQPPVQHCNGK